MMSFGNRGRSRSPRGTTVATKDIVELIVAREHARLSKDWAAADTLRDQLSASGVKLNDKTHTWNADDGRSGRIPTFAELEAGDSSSDNVVEEGVWTDKTITGDTSGTDDPEIAQVKRLVRLREQARAEKNFDEGDRLRDELKSMGIELVDKEKMWRSSDGKSGIIVGYQGNASPTNTEITTLVVQREKARQSSDWNTSDMIRDELKLVGVEILDREKKWRTLDGRVGNVPSWAEIVATTTGGGGSNAGTDIKSQIVQAALSNAQNPATAQRTLHLLQHLAATPFGHVPLPQYGLPPRPRGFGPVVPQVMVPVMASKSSVEAQQALEFCKSCGSAGQPPSDADISWLIETRERLRHRRDFAGSDEVRQAMRSLIGVELYEKEKRWQSSDGRQGEIPSWSDLGL